MGSRTEVSQNTWCALQQGLGVVSLKALEELHRFRGPARENPRPHPKEGFLAATGTLHHRADDATRQTFAAP
jgi:hypothetical protein